MRILLMMAALSLAATQNAAPPQAATGTIRVVVREPGTLKPLPGIQVVASPAVVVSSLTPLSSLAPSRVTSIVRFGRESGGLPDPNGSTSLLIFDRGSEVTLPDPYRIAELTFKSPFNNQTTMVEIRSATGTPPGTPLPAGSVTALTGADGVALIRDLSFGDYAIHAQSDNYITPADESTGKSARVSSQQLSQEVSLSLIRAATITGRVTDNTGMPLVGTRVTAATVGYKDGQRSLVPGGATTTTDSNGAYVLNRLTPGKYYIVADGLQVAPAALDTYYPGVNNFAEAISLPTQSGAEITGINFGPRSAGFSVSGMVIGPPGASPAQFVLVPRGITDIAPLRFPTLRNTIPSRDGTFSVGGIPPGEWDLIPVVSYFRTAPGEPISVTGRMPVDIVDRNIDGIVVATKSTDVSGRVLLSGAPMPGISLLPRNLDTNNTYHLRTTPGPNGEFLLRMAPQGDYRIQAIPPSGQYLADIRLGSRSIYDSAVLHIGEDPIEPLEILIRPGGGSISGSIQGAGALSDVRVVLIPSEQRRKNALLYKTTPLIPNRRSFSFANVAPGEYKVFAFSSLPPGAAEQDSNFIAEYEQEGTPITVADGGVLDISPKLISVK